MLPIGYQRDGWDRFAPMGYADAVRVLQHVTIGNHMIFANGDPRAITIATIFVGAVYFY